MKENDWQAQARNKHGTGIVWICRLSYAVPYNSTRQFHNNLSIIDLPALQLQESSGHFFALQPPQGLGLGKSSTVSECLPLSISRAEFSLSIIPFSLLNGRPYFFMWFKAMPAGCETCSRVSYTTQCILDSVPVLTFDLRRSLRWLH